MLPLSGNDEDSDDGLNEEHDCEYVTDEDGSTGGLADERIADNAVTAAAVKRKFDGVESGGAAESDDSDWYGPEDGEDGIECASEADSEDIDE